MSHTRGGGGRPPYGVNTWCHTLGGGLPPSTWCHTLGGGGLTPLALGVTLYFRVGGAMPLDFGTPPGGKAKGPIARVVFSLPPVWCVPCLVRR